ncbi:hypothetical protein L3556_14900 [Candidatus Synechococcus calcipolaris G9]|uniref:Uncharacterized protein n=1 Tax=Candidatus Synechococcus calcipolaris G9 TaxID=1497997 RepID=A0ABT6F345_9SYNE|nr:hypothetical protein [Candidatus Synechococcus calcipolaris]MDG2992206.1 hypothetical protein [Candidatus Synechococcus calcipolaris G9]
MISPRSLSLLIPAALTLGTMASLTTMGPANASWHQFHQSGINNNVPFNHFGYPGVSQPGVSQGAPIIYQRTPYSQPVIIAPDPGPGTSVIYQQRTYFPRVYAPSGFQQVQPNYYPNYYPNHQPYHYPGKGRGGLWIKF